MGLGMSAPDEDARREAVEVVAWLCQIPFVRGPVLGDPFAFTCSSPGRPDTLVRLEPLLWWRARHSYEVSAALIWPMTDPKLAAMQLLSVHLQEALGTSPLSTTRLAFGGEGFNVVD